MILKQKNRSILRSQRRFNSRGYIQYHDTNTWEWMTPEENKSTRKVLVTFVGKHMWEMWNDAIREEANSPIQTG